jgi:site-specific recombinase XerD
MFEQILSYSAHINRHRNGPYAGERERYLALLVAEGRSRSVLRAVTALLYRISERLPLCDDSITPFQIEAAARQWAATRRGSERYRHNVEAWFVFHATSWLRFLGRLQEETSEHPFEAELAAFLHFEEHERGLASATLVREEDCLRGFLHWVATEARTLHEITPDDISRYFSGLAADHRWKRTTIGTYVTSLRNFFRFAEARRWCVRNLAETIDAPRIYRLERLPRGPQWIDVQRLLADCSGERPSDIRDRAMFLLLTVYGFRSGEARLLRLDDIDWEQETILVQRTKQRKTQHYPLVATVGEAILRYLQEVRPRCSRREVFLTQYQPFRPLTAAGVGSMVRHRCLKLGLVLPCYGPHALRHACATYLLAEGFSLKEIADHLGHASLSATQIYAKVDLNALREVGQFDMGSLIEYAERDEQLATPIDASMDALRTVSAMSLGGLI